MAEFATPGLIRFLFRPIFIFGVAWLLFVTSPTPINAASTKPGIDYTRECNRVAQLAANATGVPVSVLYAISLTETGRVKNGAFDPWPWTVNMEGKGVWFENETSARAYVNKEYQRGARSFDVGCFQLNYKWHGHGFSSIREMFDPKTNALYAANFLKELFLEKGNWVDAAGAYHSRTPKYATRYKERFSRLHAKIQKNPPVRPNTGGPRNEVRDLDGNSQVLAKQTEHLPLIQATSSSAANLGSLFPADAVATFQPLFDGS